ncbi:hypothetical protein [Gynuella sp.]|uniref:hypothetical protein n=1 Tax=Gynuella sp. TaxID=2969146 RepID=UPI003D0DFAEB
MQHIIKKITLLSPLILILATPNLQARTSVSSSMSIGGYYIQTDQDSHEESSSGNTAELLIGINSEGNSYQLNSQYSGNYIVDYEADQSNFLAIGSTSLTLGNPARNYGLQLLHSARPVNQNDTLDPLELDFNNTISVSPFAGFNVGRKTNLNVYSRHSFLWNTNEKLSARDNRLGTNLVHNISDTQSANLLYQLNYNESLGDNPDNTLIHSVQAGWKRQSRKLETSAYIGFDFTDSDNSDDTKVVTFGLRERYQDTDYSWSLGFRRGVTTELLETTDTNTADTDTENYRNTVVEDRLTVEFISTMLCRSCQLSSSVIAIRSNDYDANDKDSNLLFNLGLEQRIQSDTSIQLRYQNTLDYAGSWFYDHISTRNTFGAGLHYVFTRKLSANLSTDYAIEDEDSQLIATLSLAYLFY